MRLSKKTATAIQPVPHALFINGTLTFLPVREWGRLCSFRSNPGRLVTTGAMLCDFQGLALLGGSFLGPRHLTVRKTKQPVEDYSAELPVDNEHQLASHELEPWIPQAPPDPPHGAEVSCSCGGRLNYMSEIPVVVSH